MALTELVDPPTSPERPFLLLCLYQSNYPLQMRPDGIQNFNKAGFLGS